MRAAMSKSTRNLLLLLLVALLSASAGIYMNSRGRSDLPPADADAASKLLALQLPDLAGKSQPLSQWKGQVLVVNFWATWCPPCLKEIPEFVAVSEKTASKGVQFVGISIDKADKVKAFREDARIPYPLLIAGFETMDLADDFGNRAKGLPFTVILDRDGRLHHVKLGPLSGDQLEEIIESALAKERAA